MRSNRCPSKVFIPAKGIPRNSAGSNSMIQSGTNGSPFSPISSYCRRLPSRIYTVAAGRWRPSSSGSRSTCTLKPFMEPPRMQSKPKSGSPLRLTCWWRSSRSHANRPEPLHNFTGFEFDSFLENAFVSSIRKGCLQKQNYYHRQPTAIVRSLTGHY